MVVNAPGISVETSVECSAPRGQKNATPIFAVTASHDFADIAQQRSNREKVPRRLGRRNVVSRQTIIGRHWRCCLRFNDAPIKNAKIEVCPHRKK